MIDSNSRVLKTEKSLVYLVNNNDQPGDLTKRIPLEEPVDESQVVRI